MPIEITVNKIEKSIITLKSIEGINLSGCTKNRIIDCLSQILDYLVSDDVIKDNPALKIKRFSRAVIHNRGAITDNDMEILFPPSREKMIAIWGKQIFLVAFLILRDTGLRPGELLALQWQDWQPDLRFFTIIKAIEAGTKNKIKGTKTGSVKPALVSEQTAEEIDMLRRDLENPSPDTFIFSGADNVPYDGHRLIYNFRKALIRAGLDCPELTPYWFRHTFNTRMLNLLPEETVRLLMGHKTEAMTRHYNHPGTESLKQQAIKIRETLKKLGDSLR